MKAFIKGLCILLAIGLIFQQASAGIGTFSPGTMSGVGIQRMEQKMAEALQGLGLRQSVPAAAGEPRLEMPTTDIDGVNVSAASLIYASGLNQTVNETASEFGSEDVVTDESELNPAESIESDILAEVSAMNTSDTEEKPESAEQAESAEPAESATQAVSESSTKDFTQSDMENNESKALNDSASNNITTINASTTPIKANMTAIDANVTTIEEKNLTTINVSGKTLLPFNESTANLTINATEINLTEINLTERNSTELKPTDLNSTAMSLSNSQSTNVPCKNCSNQGGQNVGGSTSAAVNGFWGMESSQHTIGGTDIKSNTFLSGDFEVDKGVKFQDRGF